MSAIPGGFSPAVAAPTARVLGVRLHALGPAEACAQVLAWALRRESRMVCLTNVHAVVTAGGDPALAAALEDADLVLPDGAPVAWSLRRAGCAGQVRVAGPDLMWALCIAAAERGVGVYLYGAAPDTLARLRCVLGVALPALRIVGSHSPPFRPATEEEIARDVAHINASGAGLVFVGLGCPRQEIWMAAQRGHVQGVLLGVGAAFDFHAGVRRRAPRWMQRAGLEWLHRLASEPRRLWRRYLVTNTRFLLGTLRAWLRRR